MSSVFVVLLLFVAGGAFAIVICRPSSDKRIMVFTILIAVFMAAGIGYTVKHLADTIAENAMWSER